MAKVTSKLQVTVPKALADRFGIRPGDEIDWMAAGETIRVVPRARPPAVHDTAARLRLFDQATRRQVQRQSSRSRAARTTDRGWRREDLYTRGRAR